MKSKKECKDGCETLRNVIEERDRLEKTLIGANAQVEMYRLREFACYQALGYSEPTNDALPHLIECELAKLKEQVKPLVAALKESAKQPCECVPPIFHGEYCFSCLAKQALAHAKELLDAHSRNAAGHCADSDAPQASQ